MFVVSKSHLFLPRDADANLVRHRNLLAEIADAHQQRIADFLIARHQQHPVRRAQIFVENHSHGHLPNVNFRAHKRRGVYRKILERGKNLVL